jgi:hypothetical protein
VVELAAARSQHTCGETPLIRLRFSARPTPSEPERSFRCIGGALRGCIGTILPTKPTLAEEVAANAVQAATRDPRFPP